MFFMSFFEISARNLGQQKKRTKKHHLSLFLMRYFGFKNNGHLKFSSLRMRRKFDVSNPILSFFFGKILDDSSKNDINDNDKLKKWRAFVEETRFSLIFTYCCIRFKNWIDVTPSKRCKLANFQLLSRESHFLMSHSVYKLFSLFNKTKKKKKRTVDTTF